jgi:hypothetical protein
MSPKTYSNLTFWGISIKVSMWITLSGVVVYAYKSERDTLMLTTHGTQVKAMNNFCPPGE